LRRVSSIFQALILLGMLVFAAAAAEAQSEYVRIDIPSKPLADAVTDFAIQAKLSIGEVGIDFGSARSTPVNGTYQKQDALKRMLSGTGFDFEFADSNTIRIRAASPAGKRATARETAIESVLVTATKREEISRDIPYSIAVTSGQQLEDFGVSASHELTTQVAGLTTTNLGSGEDKLFVRGLTDSVLPGLSESVVGVYLDESRIVDDAPDPNLRLIDIDRVEVLRGPQGSLYGAGSLSGLVRIVTNKPEFDEFRVMAQTSVSSTENGGISTSIDGMINVPLVSDALALRLVGYDDEQAGYIDELRLHLSNTNRTKTEGGRAQLAWQANSDWTVFANFMQQDTKADDSQYYLKNVGYLERNNYLLEPHSDEFKQVGITANGTLSWANVVSNTSYVSRHVQDRFDASFAWPQLTGFPQGPSPFDFARKIQSLTHETRISSPEGGRWKWLFGLSLAHREEDFLSSLSGPDASGVPVVGRAEVREDRLNEAAIFGEVTFDFTPEWSLTAGARAFGSSHNVTATGSGILFTSASPFAGSVSQSGLAPKLVLGYRPSEDTMFYAQASEGYRLGGINVDGPVGATGESENTFDSDELKDFELGSKLDFLDKHLVVDAAAYYVIWNNVQTDQIGSSGAFYVLNAGTVRDAGLEMDAAWQPIENLTLHGNFFWNNATLGNINPLLASGEGVLPGAPDISAEISARYDFPVTRTVDGFASVEYSYVGVSHLGFGENSQVMGGYRLANLRIGVEKSSWQLGLFVDNLTNDHGNTFAFGNPFDLNRGPQVTPPRPRSIGVSLIWLQ
jgi:outer membrane receptor protein involved in Fe transport